MKKYKIQIWSLIPVLSLLLFSACVTKEEGVFEDNGSSGIVELFDLPARSTSSPVALKATAFDAADVVELPITINYTGAGSAPKDISVTLKVDTTILDEYNDYSDTEYEGLPTSLYAIDDMTVVIPKGEKKVELTIKVYPNNFEEEDFFKSYAIGLEIVSSTLGTISGNYGKGVFAVSVKNQYDGVYTVNGTMSDAYNSALTGYYPNTFQLVTSGPNQCYAYDNAIGGYFHAILNGTSKSYYGSFGLVINFKSDGSGEVESIVNYWGQPASNTRSAEMNPDMDNYWDPDTKEMKLNYWMNQPSLIDGHRSTFSETWTYVGSR